MKWKKTKLNANEVKQWCDTEYGIYTICKSSLYYEGSDGLIMLGNSENGFLKALAKKHLKSKQKSK